MRDTFQKTFIKILIAYCIALVLCRVTHGQIAVGVFVVGLLFAATRKIGYAWGAYLMLMVLVMLNPLVFPRQGALFSLSVRFGVLMLGGLLVCVGNNRIAHAKPPMGLMCLFLICASVSASEGWVPAISYLKLVNFSVFFFGVWLGVRGLASNPDNIVKVRAAFLAFAVIVIFGSAALVPFPGLSTLRGLRTVVATTGVGEMNFSVVSDVGAGINVGSGGSYFCGILAHSQALAPILACLITYLLCDYLFIKKGKSWLHLVLIGAAFPLLFYTRSRTGLLAMLVGIGTLYIYSARKIALPPVVKRRLSQSMLYGAILLLIVAAVAEAVDGKMSKWIRKTDAASADDRGLVEAVTSSRMGLIDKTMYEFNRNPLFGSGFQVEEFHQDLWRRSNSLVLTAPIEKGLLVLMVLGETGLVGACVFYAFLIVFITGCIRKRYCCTLTLFMVQLATNFGEATYFSPGGIGGIIWVLCIVGGWVLDLHLRRENDFVNWGRMRINYAN